MEGKERKFKVLIVDDEEGPREALRMILKDTYEVLTEERAERAPDRILKENVDVVALDIRMPGINGMELLQNIKKTNPDVEIFLVTGYPSVSTVIEALQFGAYDYVIKPFDQQAVLNVVRRGLNRRGQNLLEKQVLGDLRFLRWV
ncbi:MAG: response regulator [Candidatus Omnitrophota bacterium]